MLKITKEAEAHLHEIIDQKRSTDAIRVSVMGSSGFGLTPDVASENDAVTLCDKIKVVVDRQLLAFCRTITIDFREGNPDGCSSKSGRGFIISAENPLI